MCKCLTVFTVILLVLFFTAAVNVRAETSGSTENTETAGSTETAEDTETVEMSQDMKQFVDFMSLIIGFLQLEFTIFGNTFSYWQVLVLSCIAGIVGYFIRNVFG